MLEFRRIWKNTATFLQLNPLQSVRKNAILEKLICYEFPHCRHTFARTVTSQAWTRCSQFQQFARFFLMELLFKAWVSSCVGFRLLLIYKKEQNSMFVISTAFCIHTNVHNFPFSSITFLKDFKAWKTNFACIGA